MLWELKKIDLVSALKVSFIINAIIGVIVGLLVGFTMAFIFSLAGQFGNDFGGFDPAAMGIFGGFFLGFVYALFIAIGNGIILTSIFVFLYNLIAGWVGGVKLHFKDAQLVQASAPQPSETSSGGNA